MPTLGPWGFHQPQPWLLIPTIQTLAALPDQDSFYDVTDALEQQGMEALVQRHLGTPGTDVDLRTQLMLYEVGQELEDGRECCISPAPTPPTGPQLLTSWTPPVRVPCGWRMGTWRKLQLLQLQVGGGSDESPPLRRGKRAADHWKVGAALCVPQNLGKYMPG
jgi:hypothetical protein